jgi:hypothetical protein
MKPGTLLRIYKHLQRIGIPAQLSATEEQVTIHTEDMVAYYDMEEIQHLLQQAPSWAPGQSVDTILW